MHPIRLRGPWELEIVARYEQDGAVYRVVPTELEAQRKATTLGDWGPILGDDFRGQVRYLRRFNRPTGLTPSTRVDLVIERVDATARVLLNGQTIGELTFETGVGRWDVTTQLKYRNEFLIDVVCPEISPDGTALSRGERSDSPGGLLGEVRLEIFDADPGGGPADVPASA
jgi:beta-galactosidase/beta-glucuronidase